ncbi:MAG: methyltransferase [Candidatus Electrothrix sp. AW2]|nr:methyltransferase [Candidatus Electrothrix gigas]
MENSSSSQSTKKILLDSVRGFMKAKALQAAAELNIADLLNNSSKSAEELARITDTHAPSLYRLLRALASEGIFHENQQGCFENTPLSEPLRSDIPDSVRDNIRYIPNDGNIQAWMRFMDVLQTGEPVFEQANGLPVWEYLKEQPDLEQIFDISMTRLTTFHCDTIVNNCDFSSARTIIDIGGGQGLLLARILLAYPQLRGALFERDSVAPRAEEYLAAQGVADRSKVILGNFLEKIPEGYDIYTMKHVLHDWSDDHAHQILCRCRKAIPPHGKLVIFDKILSQAEGSAAVNWIDLHMLVTLGGKERSVEEFDTLLTHAGFTMTGATSLQVTGMVEASPA